MKIQLSLQEVADILVNHLYEKGYNVLDETDVTLYGNEDGELEFFSVEIDE